MATNPYFKQGVKSEQNLYDDLISEAIKFYGQNMFYLPRDIINKDPVFGDDILSRFNSSYIIEMYPETTGGFGGEGDLFSKFGIEIRDQTTLVVSKKRWRDTVKRYDNEITGDRPREGDLIYFPVTKSIFEIMRVEHEEPFYQLNHLPVYQLHCELFEYNDENFDTNIDEIDNVELTGFRVNIVLSDSADNGFVIGNDLTQSISGGISVTGSIISYNDSSNTISVAHSGASDGKYHQFGPGIVKSVDSNGSTLTRTVLSFANSVGDSDSLDTFKKSNFNFIDFSENNPFGEPV